MASPPSPDPAQLAALLLRYRRMMAWLMAALFTMVVGAGMAAWHQRGVDAIHRYVVPALVIGAFMLFGSLVLGLSLWRVLRHRGLREGLRGGASRADGNHSSKP